MKIYLNRWIGIGVLGLLLAGAWYIRSITTKEVPFYFTENPLFKNLTYFITASGTLQPVDKITVGSLVAGRVIKLHADDNDEVESGQLLVTIDDGRGDSPIKKLT